MQVITPQDLINQNANKIVTISQKVGILASSPFCKVVKTDSRFTDTEYRIVTREGLLKWALVDTLYAAYEGVKGIDVVIFTDAAKAAKWINDNIQKD